jgi:hypothetical protein
MALEAVMHGRYRADNARYCWVCDFNAEGKVKRLHSFLDTAMALDVMKANGAA